jgi:hypothetical protein
MSPQDFNRNQQKNKNKITKKEFELKDFSCVELLNERKI